MSTDSTPAVDLKNVSRDPRHPSTLSKFSASARQRCRALFGRSEMLVPETSCSLLSTSHTAVVQDRHEEFFNRHGRIGSRIHGKLSPFEDLERVRNRSQNSVAASDTPSRNAASTLQGAHDFTIGGSPQFLTIGNIHQYTGTHGMFLATFSANNSLIKCDAGLEIMEKFVSFNALYDSYVQDPQRKCHPGTRQSILKKINGWIDNPDARRPILWLHGPAGVGKSAIAQTTARSYSPIKVAAATFFFFRSDPNRSDGNRLFPTIAWQLAKSIPGARSCISDALSDGSDIPRKTIEIQFERLISQPLKSIAEATPKGQRSMPVIIIDGVDECSDEQLQERLITVLGAAVSGRRIPLRFLISSRPEALIKEAFDQFRDATLQIDIATADDAYRDVEKYFKAEFSRIASKQGIGADTWPGERVIEYLTVRSSGQFVYASTVIKFVGYEYDSAPSQLDIILGLEPSDGKAPFADLDALYLEILRRQPDQEFLQDFLALLLSQCDHEDYGLLLKISSKAVFRKLRGMHSVLKTEPKFGVHHQSFLNFLQDASRSRQYHLTEQTATRRYWDLSTDALDRYCNRGVAL